MPAATAPHVVPSRLATPWGVLVFHDRKLQGVVPLGTQPLRIGRGPDCEIVIDEASVSRAHCTLTRVDGCVVATDLESTNGTWRFGERIRRSALREGDELSIGKALVKLVELGNGVWAPHEDLYAELFLDAATGCYNPRGLRMRVDGCLGVLPVGTEVGVLLLRLDRANELAQRHGAAVQQRAMQHLGALLRRDLPRAAIAARTGQAEFSVVLAGLPAARAAILGESLRVSVKESPLPLPANPCELSISVGVASQSLPMVSLHGAWSRAEDDLLRACARRG